MVLQRRCKLLFYNVACTVYRPTRHKQSSLFFFINITRVIITIKIIQQYEFKKTNNNNHIVSRWSISLRDSHHVSFCCGEFTDETAVHAKRPQDKSHRNSIIYSLTRFIGASIFTYLQQYL